MPVDQPKGGIDYPRSLGESGTWFGTGAGCLDYLEWLRWPEGSVCPRCDAAGGWRVADGCVKCRSAAEAVDGVIPGLLGVRDREGRGVSALDLRRTLQIGSTRPRGRCCTGFAWL